MIIYKITNLLNDKVYIGQTTQELKVRLSNHKCNRRSLISKALNKYGENNFKVEIIDTANSKEELDEKEIYWIRFYNCISPKGYNLTFGGEGTVGYHLSKETKEKISNANKGKKMTVESRKAISVGHIGLKLSEETKIRISEHMSTKRKVKCVETGEVFDSVTSACKKYSLDKSTVCAVCNGRRKMTGGLTWVYVDLKGWA